MSDATHSDRPDCHYFLSGNCKRGDQCEYRHEPQARYATQVCKFWSVGKCAKADCAFLHPASASVGAASTKSGFASPVDQRALTPCYWLTQPGGCGKGAQCPYLHPPGESNGVSAAGESSRPSSNVTWSKNSHSLSLASTGIESRVGPKRVADIDNATQSHAQSILSRVSVSANASENDPVTFSRKHGAARGADDSSAAANAAGDGDLRSLIKRGKKTVDTRAEGAPPSTSTPATAKPAGPFVKKLSELIGKSTETAKSEANPTAEAPSDAKAVPTPIVVDIEALKEKNKRKFAVDATPKIDTTTTKAAATTTTTAPTPTTAPTASTTSAPSNVAKKAKPDVVPTKAVPVAAVPDVALDDLDADLAAIDSLLA